MSEVKFKTTQKGEAIIRAMKELKKFEVVAGFPKEDNYKPKGNEPKEYLDALKALDKEATPLDKAVMNEFGTDTIPARPFMSTSMTMDKQFPQILGMYLTKAIVGNADADDAMDDVGRAMETQIKKAIEEGEYVPNAPYTLARKMGDKPLVDSGEMLDSVSYVVRQREKE